MSLPHLKEDERATPREWLRHSTCDIAHLYFRKDICEAMEQFAAYCRGQDRARLSETREALSRADKRIMKYENDEASVCPEDVGFVEYIGVLDKKLRGTREALAAIYEGLKCDELDSRDERPYKGYWPARKFLKDHDIYDGDLQELAVLKEVARAALAGKETP